MIDRNVEPLDPEFAALFEAERTRPEPTPEKVEAIVQGVISTLGAGVCDLAPLAQGTPGGAHGVDAGAEQPPMDGAAAVSAGVVAKSAVLKATSIWGSLPHSIGLIAAFSAGSVTGAAVYRGVAVPSHSAVVLPSVPVSAPAAVAPSSRLGVLGDGGTIEPAPAEALEVQQSPSLGAGSASAVTLKAVAPDKEAPSGERDVDLTSERVLLDTASSALARGRGAEAMQALELHAQKFPRGRLSQEREILWIRSLLALGKRGEARARADRFRRAHPGSMMLVGIEAALGSGDKDGG